MLRLKAHVASVYFKCFKGMLQVFHMNIAKGERDVVYAAVVVHVCCKFLFLMFHQFSDVCCKCVYLNVAYVSHICLQVFYLDVVYVF
jgi:hypothetical protein